MVRGGRAVGVSAAVLVGAVLAGCSAEAGSPQAEPASTQPSEAVHEGEAADLDASACQAVSDVMTIVENADIGLREGRMAAQEQRSWYQLATRVLDRIPASDDHAVSLAIADLKAAAPLVTGPDLPAIGSAAWRDALAAVRDPCLAADAELTIGVFTGG